VLLTTFKTVQALPLNFVRLLCPRMSRDPGAQRPCADNGARPQQQSVRDRRLAASRAQPRAIHGHEQSAMTFCLCPETLRCISRHHGHLADDAGRKQATATAVVYPHSVRDSDLSAFIEGPLARIDHDFAKAQKRTVHRLHVSSSLPTAFPVHVRHASAYDLI
jgi:hypothetical protein